MDAGQDTKRTEEPNSLGGCAPHAVIGGARSRRTQRVSRVHLPFGLTSLMHRCAYCGAKRRDVLCLMQRPQALPSAVALGIVVTAVVRARGCRYHACGSYASSRASMAQIIRACWFAMATSAFW